MIVLVKCEGIRARSDVLNIEILLTSAIGVIIHGQLRRVLVFVSLRRGFGYLEIAACSKLSVKLFLVVIRQTI